MRHSIIIGLIGLASLGIARADTITSSTGAHTEVAGAAASNFRCLISGLEATGYRIDFMGGFSRGHMRNSKHHTGLALDVNQTGRGRVTRPLPSNATSIAASCGLFHGALWRNQDQGHFEVGGRVYGDRSSRHRRSLTRVAPTPGFHWPWEPGS